MSAMDYRNISIVRAQLSSLLQLKKSRKFCVFSHAKACRFLHAARERDYPAALWQSIRVS